MTQQEVWTQLARECPRRIIDELHRRGDYIHGTSARYPGKVLCCHRDAALPPGWQPTPAQERAEHIQQLAVA